MRESYQFDGPTWEILETPGIPLNDVKVEKVSRYIPDGMDEHVERIWKEKLNQKGRQILEADAKENNGKSKLKLYVEKDETDILALYEQTPEGEKRIMWSSDQVILSHTKTEIDDEKAVAGVTLFESKMTYAEYAASLTPEYLEFFTNEGVEPPSRPLGSAVYIQTEDGVPLTIRTNKTNIYPGALYGVGGNASPTQSPIEHMIEEIEEESGLKAWDNFDPNDIMLIGIGLDKVLGGKPELMSTIKLKVKNDKIKSRGLTDVGGYRFVNPGKAELMEEIHELSTGYMDATNPAIAESFDVWEGKTVPPTEASLVALGTYKYGETWARKVVEDLNTRTVA